MRNRLIRVYRAIRLRNGRAQFIGAHVGACYISVGIQLIVARAIAYLVYMIGVRN